MHDSDYFLCVHCLRVFEKKEVRKEQGLEMCPYSGCDGKAMFSTRWETLRKRFKRLPIEPEPGKIYNVIDMMKENEYAERSQVVCGSNGEDASGT